MVYEIRRDNHLHRQPWIIFYPSFPANIVDPCRRSYLTKNKVSENLHIFSFVHTLISCGSNQRRWNISGQGGTYCIDGWNCFPSLGLCGCEKFVVVFLCGKVHEECGIYITYGTNIMNIYELGYCASRWAGEFHCTIVAHPAMYPSSSAKYP